MGWSGKELRCRKHPRHKQSSGVCPSCLRDKLSNLASHTSSDSNNIISSTVSTPYSSDSISYSSSSCSSSMASPIHCYNTMRVAEKFTKSRSVACDVGEGKGGRKRGFWSKLLMGPRGGEGKRRKGKGVAF